MTEGTKASPASETPCLSGVSCHFRQFQVTGQKCDRSDKSYNEFPTDLRPIRACPALSAPFTSSASCTWPSSKSPPMMQNDDGVGNSVFTRSYSVDACADAIVTSSYLGQTASLPAWCAEPVLPRPRTGPGAAGRPTYGWVPPSARLCAGTSSTRAEKCWQPKNVAIRPAAGSTLVFDSDGRLAGWYDADDAWYSPWGLAEPS